MGLLFIVGFGLALASAVMYLRGRFGPVGTTARIHVDDLAVGNAPDVCVVTGVPCSHRVEVMSSEGGFSPWWLLLLFLGPIGWVGLALLVVLGRRTNRVSGILPVSPDALARYNAMVRVSTRSMAVSFVALIGGLGGLVLAQRAGGDSANWIALFVAVIVIGGLVVSMAAGIAAPYRWVDLELDGSGRWVTIRRASPQFAVALQTFHERPHVHR